jgi:preprotein translocase subunit SecY
MATNPANKKAGLGELFARLRFVLLAIFVYRVGTHIPVPGIDPNQLAALFNQNQGTIARHHAVYFRVHHHAAHVGGDAAARAAEKGR